MTKTTPLRETAAFTFVPVFSDDIRNVCEQTLANDKIAMILFYHKDSVVAHAVMERSVADFASFDVSKKYSIRQQLFLDKERKVIVAH